MSPHWPHRFPPEMPAALLERIAKAPPGTKVAEQSTTYLQRDDGTITAESDRHVARYSAQGKRIG